jgi:hypothetical protein
MREYLGHVTTVDVKRAMEFGGNGPQGHGMYFITDLTLNSDLQDAARAQEHQHVIDTINRTFKNYMHLAIHKEGIVSAGSMRVTLLIPVSDLDLGKAEVAAYELIEGKLREAGLIEVPGAPGKKVTVSAAIGVAPPPGG